MHTWLKRTLLLPALVVAVPAFVGCASSHQTAGEAAAASRNAPETCFNASMATSFDYIAPRYMYVTAVGDDHYLLTLAEECINLQSAMGVTIRSRFEQVCSRSEDSIVYTAFGHANYCRIVNVQQVKDRAAADALVQEYNRTGNPGY